MAFTVTKTSGSFIRPHSTTPSGLLPLSSMDRAFPGGAFVTTLHVFKHGQSPAAVIKQALSKTLVHYYPIAGRLVRPEPGGDLQVDCTGEGVWFVERAAECSLDEVNWLQDDTPLILKEQLLPSLPQPGLTLMIQVTTFKCSGFVVAILFDHTFADGIGIAQFTNAVAETALGLPHLSLPPVWLRDTAIPTPPKSPLGAPPALPSFHTKPLSLTVPAYVISRLKAQYTDQTGRACSTFEVLCAAFWQCRTRAINANSNDTLHLCFAASARESVSLPEGYYGNCIQIVVASATAEKLVTGSLVEVVAMIKEAKERMGEEFGRWKEGKLVVDAAQGALSYESVIVSDWTRLGFEKVDYGWGTPEFVMPALYMDSFPTCIFVKVREGVRLVTKCVKEEHLGMFKEEMEKLTVIID